ncbi:hypothetical protein N7455_004379 [Penicillium solitum]|uniref:uncharacterized protein n=1 Tax=Penicillium solitum TaxID=60172 RepID=UPI0032C46471|nr:hypothetical protein N7455_004379 [Penicillium solitum]
MPNGATESCYNLGVNLLLLAILSDWHLLACRSDTGVEVCDLLTGRRQGVATWKGGEFQRWHWHDAGCRNV